MKKLLTLLGCGALAVASLPAHAQITLDGTIGAGEIGSGAGQYQTLGSYPRPAGGVAGFGPWGLLRFYGAATPTKLHLALAGTLQGTGNNFQLWMDLPGRTGVPAGTALPSIAGPGTLFATIDADKTYAGIKMDQEVDAVIAANGIGDVQAAVFTSATTAEAKSLTGGAGYLPDGSVTDLPPSETTGIYALFTGTRLAYLAPVGVTGDISENPGLASGGGAGSTAMEFEFDRAALGIGSGAVILNLMAAQVSPDGYWSSDVIPEVTNNGISNLAFHPDFSVLAGTQTLPFSLVVGTSPEAAAAVVALSVFPNPADGAATVTYQVADKAQAVTATVTDLLGRPVRTLVRGIQAPGLHDVAVRPGDLAAGTYLVKVQVGDKTATRRLSIAR